jgi:hypothetical protein
MLNKIKKVFARNSEQQQGDSNNSQQQQMGHLSEDVPDVVVGVDAQGHKILAQPGFAQRHAEGYGDFDMM